MQSRHGFGWRYQLSDWERAVFINDTLLKCTGFISTVEYRDESCWGGEYQATGFFVSLKGNNGGAFPYFVTAKHSLEGIAARGDTAFIRVNRKSGGPLLHLPVSEGKYWTHPSDATVDIAVSEVLDSEEFKSAEIRFISTDMFIDPDRLKVGPTQIEGIGYGTEVLIPGLFALAQPIADSNTENMPIIRTGNIAMIPKQQIQTGMGFTDVYLVEMRSIGGLSGSPAFARETIVFKEPAGKLIFGLGEIKLLGLMHGHWDIDGGDINSPTPKPVQTRGVNLGIGIVVPAHKIMEVLDNPELVAHREAANASGAERRKAALPKMD